MSLSSSIADLPLLGVGASLSFGVEPDPVALAGRPDGPDFIEYAGPVDPQPFLPSVRKLRDQGIPVLYHPSCLNLCGPWPNPTEWLEAVHRHVHAVQSPWLAQDVSVCFVGDTPGYSIQLGYFISPARTDAGLAEAIERVLEVRNTVSAPLLLEPPPAMFRWGDRPMLEWLNQLCHETDCGMLLDAGHVLSHALLEGGDPLQHVSMDLVAEVHIAGGILHTRGGKKYYEDAHELPIQPEVWKVFDHILAHAPNLKAVCVECEGAATQSVATAIERVRNRVQVQAANADLRAHVRSANKPGVFAVGMGLPPKRAPKPSLPIDRPLTGYPALVALLFDAELRGRMQDDAASVAAQLGLAPDLAQHTDIVGLQHEAELRKRYLMSALSRAYPLTTAILGSKGDHGAAIAGFLTSDALFGALGERTAAFGQHLARLLDFDTTSTKASKAGKEAVLAYEQALNANAASIRAAVARGQVVQAPRAPSPASIRHGTLALAPFSFVVELAHPLSHVHAATDGATAADVWRRVSKNDIDPSRVEAVFRATPDPITIVARGFATSATNSADSHALTEVHHRTVELRGRMGARLQSLVGERLGDLPPATASLARSLVDAGVLTLT